MTQVTLYQIILKVDRISLSSFLFSAFVCFFSKIRCSFTSFRNKLCLFSFVLLWPLSVIAGKGLREVCVCLKAANWSSHQDVQIVCMSFCFLLASSHHLNFPHLFCLGFSISYDLQVFNSQYTSLFQATIYTDKIVDKLGNIWKATEVFDKEGCVLDIIWHVIWRQNDHKNDL